MITIEQLKRVCEVIPNESEVIVVSFKEDAHDDSTYLIEAKLKSMNWVNGKLELVTE